MDSSTGSGWRLTRMGHRWRRRRHGRWRCFTKGRCVRRGGETCCGGVLGCGWEIVRGVEEGSKVMVSGNIRQNRERKEIRQNRGRKETTIAIIGDSWLLSSPDFSEAPESYLVLFLYSHKIIGVIFVVHFICINIVIGPPSFCNRGLNSEKAHPFNIWETNFFCFIWNSAVVWWLPSCTWACDCGRSRLVLLNFFGSSHDPSSQPRGRSVKRWSRKCCTE